jgi:hypothetical protein
MGVGLSKLNTRTFVALAYLSHLGLVRLIPLPMDWMGLEKNKKGFDLIGI